MYLISNKCKSLNNLIIHNYFKLNYCYYSVGNKSNSSSSILFNTKKKSSENRKIKVNHIPKEDLEPLFDYGKSDDRESSKYLGGSKLEELRLKRSVLKEQFNLFESEIDEIVDDKEGKEQLRLEQEEEENDSLSQKLYYSESFAVSNPDKDKDDKKLKQFFRENNDFDLDELDNSSKKGIKWKEYDNAMDIKQNDRDFLEVSKKQQFKKLGIEYDADGDITSSNIPIPKKFESYFLRPDEPTSRKEKKLFDRLDARFKGRSVDRNSQEYVDGSVSKFGKTRRMIVDENNDIQSIVQKRMSLKILEAVNDSPLFTPSSEMDNSEKRHFKKANSEDFDNVAVSSMSSEDLLSYQLSDPIISSCNIEFSRATMSSDLRWVKIYWKRLNENDSDNRSHFGKHKTDEEFEDQFNHLKPKLSGIDNELGLIHNLENHKSKEIIYNVYKDLFDDIDNVVRSESNIHSENVVESKIIENRPEKFEELSMAFGSNNIKGFSSQGVELNISLPKNIKTNVKEFKKLLREENKQNSFLNQPFIPDKSRDQYYRLSDSDISKRLNKKLRKHVRFLISKKVRSKYVPDVYFERDDKESKSVINNDIVDNVITPNLKQVINSNRDEELEHKSRLQSQFSSLFNSSKSNIDDDGIGNIILSKEEEEARDIKILELIDELPDLQDDSNFEYIEKLKEKYSYQLQDSDEQEYNEKEDESNIQREETEENIQDTAKIFSEFNKSN